MAMPRRPPRHHNLNSSAGLSTAASELILPVEPMGVDFQQIHGCASDGLGYVSVRLYLGEVANAS